MEPNGGGSWRPNQGDDNGQQLANSPTQAQTTATPDIPAPVSAYDGYDLTAPLGSTVAQEPEIEEVKWEASEYIQHDKDAVWFIALAAIAAILFFAAILLKQWTFAMLVIAMTASVVVYARRPPRTLHYHLGERHFSIEGKEYTYSDFKAFGVVQDGPLHMVTLVPRKRFAPPLSMYFDESDGEAIVDILGLHMPLKEFKPDAFDALVRKLRF